MFENIVEGLKKGGAWLRQAWAGAASDRWFLFVLPAYFLYLYWPVVFLGHVPAPVDLAICHAPWRAGANAQWLRDSYFYSYVLSDIMDQTFPPIRMFFDAVWSGDMPYFTDKIQNGVPWLFVARHELGSPLLFLPVLLFGPVTGYAVAIILKFLIGGYFFDRLCRLWGLGTFASALGGLVFIANAFPVQNLGHGISSMYYLIPAALYGLHRVMEGKWLWTCLTPIVLLSIFASGYPPAFAFHATLYAAYVLFWFALHPDGRFRASGHLIMTGVASLALVFPSLVESYQYLMKDLDFGYRANYWARHLPKVSVVSLLMPWGMGLRISGWTWARDGIYFGVFPLLIALSSLFLPNKKREHVFFIGFAVYLLFVLFSISFLGYVYRYIPVLNGTNPNNQTMIFSFVMAVIVSFGAERLFQGEGRDRRAVIGAGALGLLVLGAIVLRWLPLFLAPESDHKQTALAALVLSVCFFVYGAVTRHKKITQGLILLFVLTDLTIMGEGFNRTVSSDLVYPETPGVAFVRQNAEDGKVFSLETTFLADTPLWHSIRTVGGRGFFTAETKRLYRLINPSAFSDHATQYLFPADSTTKLDSKILDVLGVKYLTTNPEFADGEKRAWIESWKSSDGKPKYKLVHQGDMTVFENRDVLPKAFFVPENEVASSEEIYGHLQKNDKNLSLFAWIDEATISAEDRAILTRHKAEPLEGEVVPVTLGNSRQEFQVRANRPALMVVGDNYHRAWRVFVDGEEKVVHKVDSALRGVVLPAGEHRVLFIYRPVAVVWGVPVMAATFVLLLCGAVWFRRKEVI